MEDRKHIRQHIELNDEYCNYLRAIICPSIPIPSSLTYSMMVNDFIGIFPYIKVVEIYDIYVDPRLRNKGIGSSFIQEICRLNQDSVILLASGATSMEYPEEPSDEEIKKIIEDLEPFYLKNGFVNVNDKIGNYQMKRAYMYSGNTLGKYCISKLLEDNPEL